MTDATAPPAQPHDDLSIPVVGIGASAGGLEAFTQFLTGLPADSGMAFVLIQHLEPSHDSHLTNILSKSSPLPVLEVTDGMPVEPDHVYVIPPNTNMAIAGGTLRLTPRGESRGAHLPIDFFLRSLAQDKQRHAIGVVLSGTGSDGTLGLAEIKSAGGITFAQDESSAKQPGMPHSAAAEGCVDIILPPGDIAREVVRISGHAYLGQAPEDSGQPFEGSSEEYARIIALLRASTGVDFSHYRDSTLKRRIMRRMALGKREALGEYVALLESDEAELKALYQDVLIHVTRFFRDPKVFDSLAEVVLPVIQKSKPPGETLRVWVAGCATGEEAYSVAIALSEFQEKQHIRYPLRIFASDISESPSLERARAGIYSENIEHDVSPERLRRYFVKEDGRYRINKELREMCVFARHDVAADPPFARLDLISCRNVLIYLSASLQRRIIPAFHYALNPGGFLLLGSSETIGRDTDLFSTVDAQLKIFSKKMTVSRLPMLLPKGAPIRSRGKGRAGPNPRPPTPLDFQQAADRLLLRKFIPPGVLVNKDMDVLQFRGRTSPFLEPPQAGTTLNLAQMARESLSLELRKAIRECEVSGAPVRRPDLKIMDGRMIRRVNVEVQPITLPASAEACFLVLFEEMEDPSAQPPLSVPRGQKEGPEDEVTGMLRIELAAAQEYLETIREQCEAINEELKSSNEEMESSNEELQSTNEELETAKEELQSSNEELATMNEELRSRNLELGLLNDDLSNLLGSVQLPIIMLGSDLRLRRFTPAAGKAFRLAAADIGRPLGNLKLPIPGFDFEKRVQEVMASQEPASLEVRDQDGRWNNLKIHPYRTSEAAIDGAVVVLLDIDEVKRAQQRLQESGDFARAIVDSVREPLLLLEEDLRIHSANLSYYRLFGTLPQDTEGRRLQEVAGGRWNIPELLALLEKAPGTGAGFEDFEVSLDPRDGGPETLLLNARRLLQDAGRKQLTLLAIEDITDRRHAERDLRLLKFFSDHSPDPYYLMDGSARFTYVNRSACSRLGYAEPELLSLRLHDIEPACTDETFPALFQRVHASATPPFETEHADKAGARFPVECSATGVNFQGKDFMLVVARDITERRKAVEALHQSEERLRQAQRMEAIGKLAGGVAHDFNNLLTAINGYSALCLAQVPAEGELHDHLEEIHKAGDRAAGLTRQLLAYSRKQVLTAKVLNLNAIVSNMHNMLSRLIGENIKLALSLDESLGLVKADPGQMEQVLINLVVNARDALPNGGEITLETRNAVLEEDAKELPAALPGPYVVLSVKDNGVGIEADVQRRIFDPFFTTKGPGKGTGLGLSVVQGIISQSDGYITVDSKPGAGSQFRIFLPQEEARPGPVPRKEGPLPSYAGTETVLLVEDEDTVRNFTRKILEMNGYTVLEANSGERALLVDEQHKDVAIHILLTDVVMPGIGGRELAERFIAGRPDSRVLFMSGYTEDAVFRRNGRLQKEVNFIHKPFTPAGLARAIREALDFTVQAPAE